jgi:ligand-binding sensor domain-containing protein
MKRVSFSSVRALLLLGLAVAIAFAGVVKWRSARAVRLATEAVLSQHEFRFTTQPLTIPPNSGFETVSSPQAFLQATAFQDHLYIAGPAGLFEYDLNGTLLHTYAVGSELPGTPLVAMATGVLADSQEHEVFIATADDGILAFNGRTFRHISPAKDEARAITSILPTSSGHLLFGTKRRGVLVYDGKHLEVLHPSLDGVYVTALAGSESDLWVGTLDRGVLHFHAGAVDGFSEQQGLPDPQVQSLAVSGETTYVGTSTGVAVFQAGRFSRVLAPGVLATALLATRDALYVGSENQGVIPIALQRHQTNLLPEGSPQMAEVRQVFLSGNAIYALARDGVFRLSPHAFGWDRVLRPEGAVLSDSNISALAADRNGQLWVGYFDRGLDLLRSDDHRTVHIEDEHVFCVNRILSEPKTGAIDVATANGLVRFNESGSEQQILTRADGLIADHVTDIISYRDGLALATPAGLTFLDASGARSMYAFHGLVNNHVYALGVVGDELLAGTLGGLSQLHQGDIRANYTVANSNLKHNWITAIVPVGSEWMVGTYGAGILGLDSSRRFHAYETASGPIEINPNAMLVTPDFVLAGSLGNGLFIYDRSSERWSVMRNGLPSLNVTAFASLNGYIYVATVNGLVRIPEQKLHS